MLNQKSYPLLRILHHSNHHRGARLQQVRARQADEQRTKTAARSDPRSRQESLTEGQNAQGSRGAMTRVVKKITGRPRGIIHQASFHRPYPNVYSKGR